MANTLETNLMDTSHIETIVGLKFFDYEYDVNGGLIKPRRTHIKKGGKPKKQSLPKFNRVEYPNQVTNYMPISSNIEFIKGEVERLGVHYLIVRLNSEVAVYKK